VNTGLFVDTAGLSHFEECTLPLRTRSFAPPPGQDHGTLCAGDVVLLDDMGTKGHLTRVNGSTQVVAVGVRVPSTALQS
jgi:hypothetical protein